jgi:hypothetical protein
MALEALRSFFPSSSSSQEPSFTDKIQELRRAQAATVQSKTADSAFSPKVVILGAGPAGLMRAIESLLRGNETIVIEKREAGKEGRSNTVALTEETIQQLKACGVYQYLSEQGRIFPPTKWGYLSVRIGDLEAAMRAVIASLSPNHPVIVYGQRVIDIDEIGRKVCLTLQESTKNAQKKEIRNIDVLVNTEGAKSSTNELLGITRTTVLPKVPVIAAIFEDHRPRITGLGSFFEYVGKTLVNLATSIYYWAIFIFKLIFQGERFESPSRTIGGALILTTPDQNYLGCGFNREMSQRLVALKESRDAKKAALDQLKARNADVQKAEESFLEAEEAYNSLAHYWIKLSFCAANFFSFLIDIYNLFGIDTPGFHHFNSASTFPLKNFQLIEIGADRADMCSGWRGKTSYLIAGDALATVDPTTGLGCNTALQTSKLFKTFLEGLEQGTSLDELHMAYDASSEAVIGRIHAESVTKREFYRRDAVTA